jgi:hypothetical protein
VLVPVLLGALLLWAGKARAVAAVVSAAYGAFLASKPVVLPVRTSHGAAEALGMLDGVRAGFLLAGLVLVSLSVLILVLGAVLSRPKPLLPGSSLIIHPKMSFREMSDADRLHWFLGREIQSPPVIPGEVELCEFVLRGTETKVDYTFNPLVRLRVMRFSSPDAMAQRAAVARGLRCVEKSDLLAWRSSSNEHDLLRGIWASAEVPDIEVANRVRALSSHRHPLVAQAASAASSQSYHFRPQFGFG